MIAAHQREFRQQLPLLTVARLSQFFHERLTQERYRPIVRVNSEDHRGTNVAMQENRVIPVLSIC